MNLSKLTLLTISVLFIANFLPQISGQLQACNYTRDCSCEQVSVPINWDIISEFIFLLYIEAFDSQMRKEAGLFSIMDGTG